MNQTQRNRLKAIDARLSTIYLQTLNRDELDILDNFLKNRISDEDKLKSLLKFYLEKAEETS